MEEKTISHHVLPGIFLPGIVTTVTLAQENSDKESCSIAIVSNESTFVINLPKYKSTCTALQLQRHQDPEMSARRF